MKILRKAAVATTTAVIVLSLVACGRTDGGTDEGAGPSVISDGPATGKIEVWAMGFEADALPELVKTFEEENPDADVEITGIPWSEAAAKIQTAIAAGATPDMTMIGSSQVPDYVGTGGLAPVPEGLVDADSFYQGAWDVAGFEGAQYAVPWYVETRAIYYRKDLAEAAGFTDPPTTWEELKDLTAGLQSAGAEWGMSLPAGEPLSWVAFLPFFWQAGGEVFSESGTEYNLGSDAMVDALAYLQSFYRDGIADIDRVAGDAPIQPQFIDGTYGAFVSGPWEIAILRDSAGQEFLDEKVAVVPMPEGPGGNRDSIIGGGSWTVFTDASNPDGAWKLIRWLSEAEQQQEFYDLTTDLPAVTAAWSFPPLANDPFLSVFGAQLADTQGPPLAPTWLQVGAELDTYIEQVIRTGLDPASAARSVQDAASGIGVGD